MLSRSRVPATSRHAPPVRCRGDRHARPRPHRHLQRHRPALRPRPSGAVAGPALAGPRGDRAGDARDGAPPARPARAGRPRPGPDAPRPRARLLPGRLGEADLRRAAVLRLGRLAGGPPDGGAPLLAGDHAPRADARRLAGDRRGARAGDRGDARSPCASAARSATATTRPRRARGSTTTAGARTARSPCTTSGGSATRWSRGASGSSGSTRPPRPSPRRT